MPSETNFKKLSVVKLSKNFAEATEVIAGSLPAETPSNHVVIEVAYVGINASDLNFTNGAYFPGRSPPFDCGFEAIGRVTRVGASVTDIAPGNAVALHHYGTFAEFICVPASVCTVVPDAKPEVLVLCVSGLTAAVSLEEVGQPKKGDVALVTAAAGGTGQIAVQLLKHVYGCTVIGTCSTVEKVDFLRSIGCDHVINYKTESMDAKLTEYAPKGVDLVYECVGGEMFNTAVQHIAVHGRVIVIGAVSSYQSGDEVPFSAPNGASLTRFLLVRSASVRGFFLPHFRHLTGKYMSELLAHVESGKLKPGVDKKAFKGLEAIHSAVDYLYSGESYGKVVVQL